MSLNIVVISTGYWVSGRSNRDHDEARIFANPRHEYRSSTNPVTVSKPAYGVAGSEEGNGG